MKPLPDIIEHALRLIKPKPEQKEACVAMITERVAVLRRVHLTTIPSPGELKKELEKIGDNLKRFRAAVGKYTEACTAVIFNNDAVKQKAFLDQLDHLIVSAQWYHAALVVPHGSPQWDNVKALTARLADELLRTYSAKRSTKTAEGTFFRLASRLYEGVTGEDRVSLEQYCRDVLDNEPGHGRIEPSLVV